MGACTGTRNRLDTSCPNYLSPSYPCQPEEEEDPLSTSGAKLPAGVDEVREKTFSPPPSQRGEGQPSPELREHVGAGTGRQRQSWDPKDLMLSLFLWFFTLGILNVIANCTNAKATEMVYKTRCTSESGHVYYKVNACCLFVFANVLRYHTYVWCRYTQHRYQVVKRNPAARNGSTSRPTSC